MNALASTGPSQAGLLASMAMAMPNAVPQTPAFVNMIGLFLSSTNQATPVPLEDVAKAPVTMSTPAQIADSMIKSMLGGPSSGSTLESTTLSLSLPGNNVAIPQAASTATASAAQIANTMIQSMLGNQSSGSTSIATPVVNNVAILSTLSGIATTTSNAQDALPQLGASAPASPSADSTIQSMLSSLPSGSTSLTTPASNSDKASPLSVDSRKQLRNFADLPTLTVLAAAPTATQSSSTTGNPGANITQSTATPQLPAASPQLAAASPSAVPLPKNAIAFTATLTPMKDTNPSAVPADAPRPIAAATTANTSSVSSSPAALASAPPPAPAVQNLQSRAAVQDTGADSSAADAAGDMQQGGDTQSQQDDSTGTPARVIAAADAKIKPANAKQDDNGNAVGTPDRAPVAETALTSFPEQVRTVTATQSATPAAAPTPFQSTAEALRTSESNLPAAPQLRAGAAQEISIRIPQADSSTIDLRIVERSGQLHVDVRTSDPAMQTSLRQDLGTLTNSLERAGYHSETFTPSSTLGRAMSSPQTGNHDDGQDQSQKRGGTSDFSGGRRQQQQQKRPSIWLEELEDQQ